MPDPVTAIIGGVSTVAGGAMKSRAAKKAGGAQERAAEMGIQEQRAARLATERLMAPYVQAGTGSLEQQQAILGLLGPEAQQQSYASIEQGPMFQALAEQGEQGILQNAAATGGLRGGNIQAALGQFRPQMLQNMIQQQYANLSGLTSLGQASASGQASSGQQAAGNIGNLYGQIGQAQAGSALGQGQAWGQVLNAPMQLAGMASGAGMGMGEFLGF
tara:strand:+ start:938 stop:1588 length:651 start_codon:yes stop_codon:yes gene_type:complete